MTGIKIFSISLMHAEIHSVWSVMYHTLILCTLSRQQLQTQLCLIASFSLWIPRFNPRAVHVAFVVKKVVQRLSSVPSILITTFPLLFQQ